MTNELRQQSVSLSSLGYNTWRNERTQANRNVRAAGIELLLKPGALERVVFFSHFERDAVRGNPRTGRAYVLTIKDLGALTKKPRRKYFRPALSSYGLTRTPSCLNRIRSM